jgi:glycosyltransferase involved in cell wall biosynthesis
VTARSGGRPIRVLESFTPPKRTTNPYLVQLARALEADPGLEVKYFTYRSGIVGRYDVFHVHWPELLVGGHRSIGRAARRALAILLVLRLRLTRTAVVRTWHNVERPTGLARIDYSILAALDRATTVWIRLNDVSEPPSDRPVVTIPHGHYQDWFSPYPTSDPMPGAIAFVGLIRRYKGVEALIDAFRDIDDPAISLAVHGNPTSDDVAGSVMARAAGDDRISLDLAFLDEQDLVTAITSASLVVLPYRQMHNSGTVLACLSLARPVLVPDTEVNRRIDREVGGGWIHTFRGELTSQRLQEVIDDVTHQPPASVPDLQDRGWHDVSARHRAAFEVALHRG